MAYPTLNHADHCSTVQVEMSRQGKRYRNETGEDEMRKMMLALAATSLAVPVAMAPEASARTRYYAGKTWYDGQGRLRCRRNNGTTGLIVGAAGGALIGRAIDTRGSRVTGTIVGAAAGALIGREVERSRKRYVCR
jgi:hypothetical protein